MKPKRNWRGILLTSVLAACMLLSLIIGFTYFSGYLQDQIFTERTAQLNELTAQVRVNLDSALDSHWNYLTAAVNLLKDRDFDTDKEVIAYIGELADILETDKYSSMLMMLDGKGNCYDASGKHGVWSDIDRISSGEDRYTFISDTFIYDGSYWAFVQKLEAPFVAKDSDISFTHMVLLKDVYTLMEYYDSSAYENKNETYILKKSNGTRMHDDVAKGNTIRSYNVLKALEEMEEQEYHDIRGELSKTDLISTNFMYEGREYYYCIASLDEYDTLLMFLIPAEFVASGTVNTVNAVIRMLLIFVIVLLAMIVLSAIAIAKQQSSAQLFRQEQENLRKQEEMNAQLEKSNAMLERSKETAEQAFRIAEEANRAKSSFLSNMSHDIRTPMNAIVGFATLLTRDAENPEKVREYTKKITSSSQHLLGLINDILDISKIEAGKNTLNLSDENIVEVIDNIDSIIRPQMKAKGHSFEVYNLGLKHEQVVLDKLRLNQILLNLLSNAVKYTPDGGTVSLTVQELPQHTKNLAHFRFIVKDNGYGMSKEYVTKIFQTFTREEDSVTNKIQGTGLGMAITKNLIDLMGGTITVESEKGEGSTFTVDLELHISEKGTDIDFWKKHGIVSILAVDDEEVICKNIQMTMEETGVKVDYALNGGAAIEMIKQSEREGRLYDIVLLDWKMPGMDGVETAKRIRGEIPNNVPIIILSSYDWLDIEEAATSAGVDAFLVKPFFLTNFRQRVDAVLSRSAEANETNETKDKDENKESVLKGMHILVAEDNEINAEILGELLDMVGATCDICENGKLAAETFEKSAPGEYQLILMDVQMPVMNGYEATREIRKLDSPMARTIPIVAMTANAFAEDIRDALEAGMNAHVAKPIDMAVLEQTVGTVLKSQSEE